MIRLVTDTKEGGEFMNGEQLWIKVAARLIVAGVLGFVIVFLSFMTGSWAEGSLMRVEIKSGFLAGRFEPNKQSPLEAKLYCGDEITIEGISSNGWAIFKLGGDTLYCDASYLRPVEDCVYVVKGGKLNGRKKPGGEVKKTYKIGTEIQVIGTLMDDDGIVWGYTSDKSYVNMEYLELK